jgi:hypothetical protein
MFVRLAAVEGRGLQRDAALPPSRRDHVARDVRGVEPVMPERRGRILARGRAVHERDRPQGRLSHRRELQPDRARADGMAVGRGQVHEKVVRMLVIHQRLAVERLPRLEQLGRAPLGKRRRLQRVHHHEGEAPTREVALEHEHVPVAGFDRLVAGGSALVVELEPRDAHDHERPRGHGHARHGVVCGHARHPAHVGLEEGWTLPVLGETRRGPGHRGQGHAGEGRPAHPHRALGTPRSRPARA